LEQVLRESGWTEEEPAPDPQSSEAVEEAATPRVEPVVATPQTPVPATSVDRVETPSPPRASTIVMLVVVVGVVVAWGVSRDKQMPAELPPPRPSPALSASAQPEDVGAQIDLVDPRQPTASPGVVSARHSVSSARSRAQGVAEAVAERSTRVEPRLPRRPRRPRLEEDDFHRVEPPAVQRPEVLSPFED
jgi:hypothetical protein